MVDRRIFRLCKRLSEDLTDDWTVEKMASGFDLSIPHFQKLFKQEVKMPPIAYLRDLRLEKVAELLLTTYDSVKQIGVKAGFKDESHLTRDFKKKFGMTPTDYRRRQAEIEQSLPPDGQE